ncbi:uncharacterized protein LOC127718651 [Mytilus californianus]|uniref:uncharacterized protein LOC127718651 n=1 Tax=Mytilus californianus TaxID=6549 RepID=UPI0022457C14|nr:uncharacterized protein LOC127718651 [Mytilus californianus]
MTSVVGSVYTRWGREDCPSNGTELVYTGKIHCYGNWHQEYYGRLAANANKHAAGSEYVCVDHMAQYRKGGGSNANGKLFFKVEAKCGSLPCPPYYDTAPMSCVVCFK